MRLRNKLLLRFFVPTVLIFLFAGSVVFLLLQQTLLANQIDLLTGAAVAHEQQLQSAIERYITEAESVAFSANLSDVLEVALPIDSEGDVQSVSEVLESIAANSYIVEGAYFADPSGEVLAGTNQEQIGQVYTVSEDLVLAGQAQIVDIFKDEEQRVRLLIRKPYYLDGTFVGVLDVIARNDLFVAITEDYTGHGETGEVVIAKRNAVGDAVFVNPLRFDSQAALNLAVSKEQENIPIYHAVRGEEVVLMDPSIVDYRGARVIAVTRYLESVEWGMVVKVDRSEVFGAINQLLFFLGIIGVSIFLAVTVMAYVTARSLKRPLQKLTTSANRLNKGDFDVDPDIQSGDEFEVLGDSFEDMATRLKANYRDLEKKVRERTRELSSALEQLEEQNTDLEETKRAMANVLEDMQEEKQRLELANAQTEAIFSSLGEGLVVTDENFKILMVNKAASSILPYSKKDLLQGVWPEVIKAEEIESSLEQADADVVRANVRVLKLRAGDGEVIIGETSSPVMVNDELFGYAIVFRDITHQEAVDRAKSEFVSLASHQLRTPLTAINWYVELLLNGDVGPMSKDQKAYLKDIYYSSKRMGDLVKSLLNVSRLDVGTFTIEPSKQIIANVIDDVIDNVQKRFEDRDIDFSKSYDKDIGEVEIDTNLFGIVVENLLTNAYKYTPDKGSVTLRTKKEDGHFVIEVEDTGFGIPQSQQKRIFEKLFRADNAKDKDTEGNGLGLYMTQQIVQKSGGKIWFESTEGEGTTFFVRFPLSGMKAKEGTKSLQ